MLACVPLALVSILYWLSLSTWFGAAVFVAVAAPSIIRTVRENDPLLPTVLSVNLEGQHGTLLAGSIVNNLLSSLSRLAYLCAGGLLLALVGEWVLVAREGRDWVLPLVRSALFVAAVALVVYDGRVVRPKVLEARRTYIDNADEPDVANPARERFEHFGRESVTVLQYLIFVLLGLVLFSGIGLARGLGTSVSF
jgi:hypothetical protein